jgi:hypothetical protein
VGNSLILQHSSPAPARAPGPSRAPWLPLLRLVTTALLLLVAMPSGPDPTRHGYGGGQARKPPPQLTAPQIELCSDPVWGRGGQRHGGPWTRVFDLVGDVRAGGRIRHGRRRTNSRGRLLLCPQPALESTVPSGGGRTTRQESRATHGGRGAPAPPRTLEEETHRRWEGGREEGLAARRRWEDGAGHPVPLLHDRRGCAAVAPEDGGRARRPPPLGGRKEGLAARRRWEDGAGHPAPLLHHPRGWAAVAPEDGGRARRRWIPRPRRPPRSAGVGGEEGSGESGRRRERGRNGGQRGRVGWWGKERGREYD